MRVDQGVKDLPLGGGQGWGWAYPREILDVRNWARLGEGAFTQDHGSVRRRNLHELRIFFEKVI
jgi:hypothetical protein